MKTTKTLKIKSWVFLYLALPLVTYSSFCMRGNDDNTHSNTPWEESFLCALGIFFRVDFGIFYSPLKQLQTVILILFAASSLPLGENWVRAVVLHITHPQVNHYVSSRELRAHHRVHFLYDLYAPWSTQKLHHAFLLPVKVSPRGPNFELFSYQP